MRFVFLNDILLLKCSGLLLRFSKSTTLNKAGRAITPYKNRKHLGLKRNCNKWSFGPLRLEEDAMPHAYRRGYAVALLIGIDENKAVVWKMYSQVAKQDKTIHMNGLRKDSKTQYNFHEDVINAIRASISEGVKSIIVTAPPRTNYAEEFLNHVRAHHVWLTQSSSKATFGVLTGSATSTHDVTLLTRTVEFKKMIGETMETETENLLELLEKRLNADTRQPLILYSLDEAEDAILGAWIPGKPKPETLLVTDTYLYGSHQKSRVNRLMQIATNRGVQTRTVQSDTVAGKRLLQLGGLVCILKPV
jgi:stalled ribosome rescue protein Dom34